MQPDAGMPGSDPELELLRSLPLPPTFPPGVDPRVYKIDEVSRLLKQAAYVPLFSVPDPSKPNVPVPLDLPILSHLPFLVKAVEVNEEPHRFRIATHQTGGGPAARNQVGKPESTVHIRWTPIPENYSPAPDQLPPTTLLNPFCSQRFTMLNGKFRFLGETEQGFDGFGTGRTFPVMEGNVSKLRIGAVIDILEGVGSLAGIRGTVVVNGTIEPPEQLNLNIMARLLDPQCRVLGQQSLPPVQSTQAGDSSATFMTFLGEIDPSTPVRIVGMAPDGRFKVRVRELLRLVAVDAAVVPGQGLRSETQEGPVVGRVEATLYFNPMAQESPSPIQTEDGVFEFFDPTGRSMGQIFADMVEGRAFQTPLEGAPMPIFRFGGFGPITGGSGQFANADGMMTMNSAISFLPRTLSNLYIFRFYDPEQRFRTFADEAHS